MSGSTNPFPETAGSGGGVPPHLWNPEKANAAGLLSFDEMRQRFNLDTAATLRYGLDLKLKLNNSEIEVLRAKAQLGGVISLVLLQTEHGGKADVYKDLGIDRSTASRYQRLFDYFPWAISVIQAEVTQAQSQGKDTGIALSIDHVITVGKAAADAVGASKRKRRTAYFSGDKKVWMVDPFAKTVELTDVPAVFPGTKKKGSPHWIRHTLYEEILDKSSTQLWVEQETGRQAYYELVVPVGSGLNVRLRDRAILLRASKKKEMLDPTWSALGLKNEAEMIEQMTAATDFEAREPKKIEVLSIDPGQGMISRVPIMDNALLTNPEDYRVTALTHPVLSGLTLLETDDDSPLEMFVFQIGEQQFKNRSFIVRMEESRWFAPLNLTMHSGGVKKHVAFTTLEAAMVANNSEMPVDEYEGFETIDSDESCLQYLGLNRSDTIEVLRSAGLWGGAKKATEEGYYKYRNDTKRNLWNIERARALVNSVKAQWEQAAADGFSFDAEPSEFGAKHHGEFHTLTIKALGLDSKADTLQPLQDRGYMRIISGRRFYHVPRLLELTAKAKGEQPVQEPMRDATQIASPAPEPIDAGTEQLFGEIAADTELPAIPREATQEPARAPDDIFSFGEQAPAETKQEPAPAAEPVAVGQIGDFSSSHVPSIEANLVQLYRRDMNIPEKISDYAIYRALWENRVYLLEGDAARQEALAKALGIEPATAAEPVQEPQETVREAQEAVQEPQETDAELSYAAMGYEDRALSDQKLADDLNGRLDSVVRRIIGVLTQLRPEADDTIMMAICDDLKAISEIATKGHETVAALVDHLDVLKSEAMPTISPDEVARFYVNTATATEQELPVDITKLWMRTKAGDTTIFDRADDHSATLH